MSAQPEALARAHIKPGTKFYHGGHGTSHFSEADELHLPESHVDRLVKDGLLAAPPAAQAQTAVAEAEQHPAAPAAEVEQPQATAEAPAEPHA